METEGPLRCSQEHITGSYSDKDEYSTHHHILHL
jgi:hypothetical protein